MARTQVEALISDRISGGKKVLKKELEQKAVDRFKAFVAESTHWPALFKLVCDTLLGFVGGTVVNLFEFLDYCNPFQLRRHSE